MRPVIFLDMDGVVVTNESLRLGPRCADVRCVSRLNVLVASADAEVVISSSWRIPHSLDFIREVLAVAGFRWPERIIDATAHLTYRVEFGTIVGRAERADEIRAWLANNPREQFVILDDEWDAEISGHYIRTSPSDGLVEEHVTKALAILTRRGSSAGRSDA